MGKCCNWLCPKNDNSDSGCKVHCCRAVEVLCHAFLDEVTFDSWPCTAKGKACKAKGSMEKTDEEEGTNG